MTDIVSGVLKLTFGFLANNIRKEAAERLKDSDLTGEECRRLIVTELYYVKSKLDDLATIDLFNSLSSLQEGINGLYQSLFSSDGNIVESTVRVTPVEASRSINTGPNSASCINEAVALRNIIISLKIHSNERFESAIKSFELTLENATKAFSSEALSIEDRIQASQIRMMARILENLEDPEASVSDCLQYLKQLHDVGAIQETFSVLTDGGMKSWFNRENRLNNASSVQDMNQRLFDFSRKFTKSILASIFRWPMISLSEHKSYKPVFGEEELVEKLRKSGVQVMSPYPDFTFDNEITKSLTVVNSKGHIVVKIPGKNTIEIFKRSGDRRTLCEVPKDEHASEWYIKAMDIDAEDNIYVITAFRDSNDQSWSFKLFIFDENGNKKLESQLSFHQSDRCPSVRIAIHEDGRIAILNNWDKLLYIGKACSDMNLYEVEKTFSLDKLRTDVNAFDELQFSHLNGTEIIVNGERAVYIYAESGQIQREIKIPDEHGCVKSVVINHVTKCILVKTYQYSGRSSLLSFSESKKPINSSYLGSGFWIANADLISHPNGPLALVDGRKAILLQR